MKQLLAIEYTKLKKLNSLKILLFCYIGIVPLLMFAIDYIIRHLPELAILIGGENFFKFPVIWKLTTFSASFVNILLCVSVVIITCNEIHFKTMRQNVIDGLSKSQVIFAKFLIVVLFSMFVAIYTFLIGLVFGAMNDSLTNMFDGIDLIFRYFIQTLGYFSFAFLFALLLRKPALAIILFIAYFPVEFILQMFVGKTIYQFFPLKSFADFTPVPFGGLFAQIEKNHSAKDVWYMPLEWHYIVVFIYIAIFFGLSYFILKKRDL